MSAEYILALRRITSSPGVLRGTNPKVLSEILSEAIPHISAMSAAELRALAKSVLVTHQTAPDCAVNNQLFRLMNRRIVTLMDACEFELMVPTFASLSKIVRQRHDGGPPSLRPDTVARFVQVANLALSVSDRCELLTILARLNLKPPVAHFTAPEIETLHAMGAGGNGRICGAVLALAKLGFSVLDFTPILLSRISGLSTMELSNLLYALAIRVALSQDEVEKIACGKLANPILQSLLRKKTDASLSSLSQVGVAYFALKDALLSPALHAFCEECVAIAERDKSVNRITVSKAQAVIRRSLDSVGITAPIIQEEFPVGPFRLDFAIPSLQLGIEINGPFHYYYKSQTPTAKSAFKRSVLEQQGWRILEIDYLDLKAEDNKVALVETRLRSALQIEARGKLKTEIVKLMNSY